MRKRCFANQSSYSHKEMICKAELMGLNGHFAAGGITVTFSIMSDLFAPGNDDYPDKK